MRRFGRALERCGVEYLLISGQASVLYGASTFSELRALHRSGRLLPEGALVASVSNPVLSPDYS